MPDHAVSRRDEPRRHRVAEKTEADESDGAHYWQCLHGGKSREYTGFFRNSSGLYFQNCDTVGNVWITVFCSLPPTFSTFRT